MRETPGLGTGSNNTQVASAGTRTARKDLLRHATGGLVGGARLLRRTPPKGAPGPSPLPVSRPLQSATSVAGTHTSASACSAVPRVYVLASHLRLSLVASRLSGPLLHQHPAPVGRGPELHLEPGAPTPTATPPPQPPEGPRLRVSFGSERCLPAPPPPLPPRQGVVPGVAVSHPGAGPPGRGPQRRAWGRARPGGGPPRRELPRGSSV